MPGYPNEAELPPKRLNKKKQAAGSGPSNLAPNSTNSKCPPSDNLPEWPPSEDRLIYLEINNNQSSPFVEEEEGICPLRLGNTNDANVIALHVESLQPRIHDTRGFHQPPSNGYYTIDYEEIDRTQPPFSDQNTGAELFINSNEPSPGQAYANNLSSARDQQQIFERKAFPTYNGLQEGPQPQPWTTFTCEHLQASFIDYQLGIWAYSTLDTEITFTERMEKANWEYGCLERL